MILTGNKPKKARSGIACTLIRFSLPLIFSGILQQLYNWADAFIVGNVEGELALAAIGATGTVVNFYLMAITGFTIGLAILFAQKFGSGENAAIPKILAAFSILLGLSFVLLAAVGIGLTSPLLRLMHTPQDTIKPAESYLKIIFTGVPFLAVYNVYCAAWNWRQPRAVFSNSFLFYFKRRAGSALCCLAALGRGGGCRRNGPFPGGNDDVFDRLRRPKTRPAALAHRYR